MIVIIPCGGKKREMPCAAGNLYIGPYFKGCMAYALSKVGPERVFILSAKYGLISPNDRIEPYDLRMGNEGCVTADKVREQAIQRGLLGEEVTALGGDEYIQVVKQVWPNAATPLTGVGGIGYQLQWLKANRGRT